MVCHIAPLSIFGVNEQKGFLHLSYHSLVLTLLRRIIRSTALAPLCSHVAVLNDTRKLASNSAEAAMAFVRSLRPDHLEAFWFFCKACLVSIGSLHESFLH